MVPLWLKQELCVHYYRAGKYPWSFQLQRSTGRSRHMDLRGQEIGFVNNNTPTHLLLRIGIGSETLRNAERTTVVLEGLVVRSMRLCANDCRTDLGLHYPASREELPRHWLEESRWASRPIGKVASAQKEDQFFSSPFSVLTTSINHADFL